MKLEIDIINKEQLQQLVLEDAKNVLTSQKHIFSKFSWTATLFLLIEGNFRPHSLQILINVDSFSY